MSVNENTELNFLYRFEAGSAVFTFSDVSLDQPYNGEFYTKIQIANTAPRFTARPEEAEIDVTMNEQAALSDLFINGPPPYRVKLIIYEYDRVAQTVTPYYRGWVVRAPFRLTESLVQLHLKSVWHFFERLSLVDSLSALSRYSVYDPRVSADYSSLRTGITVTALNDHRDILTVTGITQPDDHFRGGFIEATNTDKRTIIAHYTEAGEKKLQLSAAFPEFTLSNGFTADIYPGDDLTYGTWTTRFAVQTNNGQKFGGWTYMPNVDPSVKGVS